MQCTIRPSSAQPQFVAPLSESLADLDIQETGVNEVIYSRFAMIILHHI